MEELLEIAKKVSVKLTEREETVSVIESSSGGLISSSLLAQPGASAYYQLREHGEPRATFCARVTWLLRGVVDREGRLRSCWPLGGLNCVARR